MFLALQFSREYPLVLPVRLGFTRNKELESGKGSVVGSGIF
jgi:hypothetical protein